LETAKPPALASSAKPVRILVGDIASSHNVVFTEAMRERRQGLIDLWIACHDDETARRAASRVEPDLAAALRDAMASGSPVEVMVSPESSPARALETLLAVRSRVRVFLLWSSRNGGYLFSRTATMSQRAKKPDLLLDVGVGAGSNGVRRISWAMVPEKEELFIPLGRDLWLRGRSHPTGRESVQAGAIAEEALKDAVLID
ncbi:MAG TPA: hypothetical protein VFB30_07770, partial [Spirochaetia bacterium]|nr:hypothetical protein [Spirochaetia bacterium]